MDSAPGERRFRGPIYATPATIDLCGILLPDSGHLQEEDAAFYNKIKKSKHDPALPLYTLEEAQKACSIFTPVPFGETKQLSPEISFRFVRAAHILGSCMAEITLQTNGQTRRLLFTGDIGRVRDQNIAPGKVVHSGPTEGESGGRAGDGVHVRQPAAPDGRSAARVGALIRQTVERGGSVVVPAFAVERTQKFLFMLKELMESGQIPRSSGFLRQPDGDQGGRDLHEAHRRIQRRHAPT